MVDLIKPFRRAVPRLIAVALGAASFAADEAHAAGLAFERVIAAGDPVPGQSGVIDFLTFPLLSDGVVAFAAAGEKPMSAQQIYGGPNSAALTLFTGVSSPIPSGTGNFTSYTYPSFYGGILGFGGLGSGGQSGIYAGLPGSPSRIADLSTAVPGGGGATFTSFEGSPLGINAAGDIAFAASSGSLSGIYRSSGGTLSAVATNADSPAGMTATFSSVQEPSLLDSATAFFGDLPNGGSSQTGLFLRPFSGGNIETIVLEGGTAPGGGQYIAFSPPITGGDWLGFVADYTTSSDPGQGIFRRAPDGGITTILATGDTIPGTDAIVATISPDFSLNEHGDIAFSLTDLDQNPYILAYIGGAWVTVADSQTLFGGKPPFANPLAIGIGQYSYSENEVAVYAVTGPGEFGIYTATVPEPGSLALLAAALLVVGAFEFLRRPGRFGLRG